MNGFSGFGLKFPGVAAVRDKFDVHGTNRLRSAISRDYGHGIVGRTSTYTHADEQQSSSMHRRVTVGG
jgi:hypothetical protein